MQYPEIRGAIDAFFIPYTTAAGLHVGDGPLQEGG
ncbi:hypothetical protein EYZ11_001099 [Aspergillus tanneri]|uniref:Uncharacterized protein n=1 Tax=Aspergillus tanneri TaxID=1220188 RepID=A0A4S3JVK7_9EURO|nr:hypothetical protein EYZ11_001099 [Aspergillus tanneri]